ncbi:MAG: type II secretion system F family protein [Rhizobiaceae bacterium]
MSQLIIYLAVFLCTLILSDTVLRGLRNHFEKKKFINYRISLIESDSDRREVYERMLKERGLNFASQGFFADINRYLTQSGLRYRETRAILQVCAMYLVFAVLVLLMGYNYIVALIAALVLTVVTCVLIVWQVRRSRITKFVGQLPEALDVIVRSLSAGHPLPTSINLVSREMPDPVGSEFGIMSDEMTYGTDIEDSLRNMEGRIGAPELNLLAISLSVQRGTGGNLSEILSNLADMIRRRIMMKAKIRAISAEGRLTSWFMLLFPFFLYGMIKLLRDDYFVPLWESGYGNMFVMAGCALMIVGMLILRKLVNFDY